MDVKAVRDIAIVLIDQWLIGISIEISTDSIIQRMHWTLVLLVRFLWETTC